MTLFTLSGTDPWPEVVPAPWSLDAFVLLGIGG